MPPPSNCTCTANHAWAAAENGRCLFPASNDSGLCDPCQLTWDLGGACAPPDHVSPVVPVEDEVPLDPKIKRAAVIKAAEEMI